MRQVITLFLALIASSSWPAASAENTAERRHLVILIDGSGSVDQARLADALARLRKAIPALPYAIRDVRIGIFDNEGPFTKLSAPMSIPSPGPLGNCSSETLENGKDTGIDPVVGILPGIKEYERNKTRAECENRNQVQEQANQRELKAALDRIRSAIPEVVKPQTGCTAIAGLLGYVASSRPASTVIVITDAEETCAKGPLPRIPVPDGTRVIMFLVPKKGRIDIEGPEAVRRASAWKKAVQMTVLPYTGIEPECLNQLLAPAASAKARVP